MDDPNIILIILPLNIRAEKVLCLKHNKSRYQPPYSYDSISSSRGTTPATQEDGDPENTYSSRLIISFDQKPKDFRKGYVFGSGPNADVLLGSSNDRISRDHFRITLDENGGVVLYATSKTRRVIVSQNGDGECQERLLWRWTLFRDRLIKVTIDKSNNPNREPLQFAIVYPQHGDCQAQYKINVNSFLKEAQNSIGPMDLLNISSAQSTAVSTRQEAPNQRPIYIKEFSLGSGKFGEVYKILDVSTATAYAGKYLKSQEWNKEIELMRELSHEHIVQFVDFTDEVDLLLVLEYFPLGNLHDQHQQNAISLEDSIDVLLQCLRGLDYLHRLGYTHHNIKPQNILVKSRLPFSVKIADSGLASNAFGSELCWSAYFFTAPEVWGKSSPLPRVDIWSLGLVIFTLRCRLPTLHYGNFSPEVWYRELNKTILKCNPDSLTMFLSKTMLKLEPQERLSAQGCLTVAGGIFGKTRTAQHSENLSEIRIRGQVVTLLAETWQLNATQVCLAAGLGQDKQSSLFDQIKKHCLLTTTGNHVWIPFKDGVFLCQEVELYDEMLPLLLQANLAFPRREENYLIHPTHPDRFLPPGYKRMRLKGKHVTYLPSKGMVNLVQFLTANGIKRSRLHSFWPKYPQIRSEYMRKGIPGTYITFEGVRLVCQSFGLSEDPVDDMTRRVEFENRDASFEHEHVGDNGNAQFDIDDNRDAGVEIEHIGGNGNAGFESEYIDNSGDAYLESEQIGDNGNAGFESEYIGDNGDALQEQNLDLFSASALGMHNFAEFNLDFDDGFLAGR